MTFLEKAKEICKEKGETFDEKEIIKKCPEECGLENESECMIIGECACIECWNREMPLKCPNSTRMMNREMPNTEAKEEEPTIWEMGYNEGMKDAWAMLRDIANMTHEERNMKLGTNNDNNGFRNVLFDMIPQEALAKLKAYEEAQKIKVVVGDVVEITHCDEKFKGLVLDILDEISFVLLTENGMVESYVDERVKKTGKHIDIKSILESIGD